MMFRQYSLATRITLFIMFFVLLGSATGFFRREDVSTARSKSTFDDDPRHYSEVPEDEPSPLTRDITGGAQFTQDAALPTKANFVTATPSIKTRYTLGVNLSSAVSRITSSTTTKRIGHHFRTSSQRSSKETSESNNLMKTTRLCGGAETEQKAAGGTAPVEGKDAGGANPGKAAAGAAFLGNHLDNLRKKSLNLPKSIALGNGGQQVMEKVKSAAKQAQQTSSRVVPSFVTTLSLLYTADKGISFLTLYALALLGASCGFHLFLHFITIGYALGIGLPLAVALYVYNKHPGLPRATFFHSLITVVWSVRMLAFFIWREYFSWPALHEKVVEIQRRMSIPFASRLLCWLVYSFFYLAMMSMTWSRLQQGMNAKWGLLGGLGLLMQIGGLGLETIADLQKNGFKSHYRHAWCNVGVWKWSTHPNYLGEGLFWWGAYMSHGFHSIPYTVFATIGLGFIISVLKGSTRTLSIKHMEKYGDQPEFFEFQRTHSIWGPKQFWWWLHGMEHLSESTVAAYTATDGNTTITNVTNTNTSALEDNTTAIVGAL